MWFLINNPWILFIVFIMIGLIIYVALLVKRELTINRLLKNKQFSMRLDVPKRTPLSNKIKILATSTITPIIIIGLILALSPNNMNSDLGMVSTFNTANDIEDLYSDFSNRMEGYVVPNFRDDSRNYMDKVESGVDYAYSLDDSVNDGANGLDYYGSLVATTSSVYSVHSQINSVITDGHYIYTSNDSNVLISIAYTDTLKVDALNSYKELPLGEYELNGMYVDDDYLMVVKSNEETVTVMVYSKENDFTLMDTYILSGEYIGSKKVGSDLFVVTNEDLDFASANFNLDEHLPYYDNGLVISASYKDINYSEGTYPNSFTTVYGIHLDTVKVDMEVILGDSLYSLFFTEKNMYLVGNVYLFEAYSSIVDYENPIIEIKTAIIKIETSENNIDYLTTGIVEGYALNELSMKELDDQLYIVTSTVLPVYQSDTMISQWDNETINRLWVLDNNLSIVDIVGDNSLLVDESETVKSTRYIGDYCYISTFEKPNSLYVIDLSGVKAINLGEMLVPDNNDFLIPVNNQYAIGLRLDQTESGTKAVFISGYNISDKSNPIFIDQYVLSDGQFGYNWSSATYELNELNVNLNKGIITIPYTLLIEGNDSKNNYGLLLFEIDSNFNIADCYHVSHETNLGDSITIDKSFYIDEYLYTVSSTFIKASLIGNPEVFIKSLELE